MESFNFRGGRRVEPETDDFNTLKHQLHLATNGDFGFVVFDLWKIENLESVLQFDRSYGDFLKVPCWLKVSEMGYENNIEYVAKRGITFTSASGMKFSTGRIDLTNMRNGKTSDTILVFCEVAVGRALVTDEENFVKPIPPGYDSYYCPLEPLDRDKDGNFSLAEYSAAANFGGRSPVEYKHTYFVKNPKQVCPKYVVKVQPVGIDSYVPNVLPTNIVEFVDAETFKPAHVTDTKSEENKFRQLLSPEAAYSKAKRDASSPDQMIASKNDIIMGMIAGLDERVRAININYADCYEQIVQAQKDALADLERVTRSKLEGLLSVEVELRRQQEELLWLKTHAEKQAARTESEPAEGTPSEFIKTWRSHIALRNKLANAKPKESGVLLKIMPDMKVQKMLNVVETSRQDQHGLRDGQTANSLSEGFVNAVKSTLQTGLFKSAFTSKDEIVSMHTQSIIERYSERIQAAINEAVEVDDIPLPNSITRPLMAGEVLSPKNLLDPSYAEDTITKVDAKKSFEKALDFAIENYSEKLAEKTSTKGQTQALQSPSVTTIQEQQREASPSSISVPLQHQSAPPISQKRQLQQQLQPQQQPTAVKQMINGATVFDRMTPKNTLPPRPKNIPDMSFSVDELRELTGHLEQFSLVAVAEQKLQRLGPQLKTVKPEFIFPKTSIFSDDEAQTLYYSLPFFAKVPVCQLLYSSGKHKRSLDEVYLRCAQSRTPALIAIRSGDFIFGAYLSHPVHLTGVWNGSPSCFIFSSTLGIKFSYHGRQGPDESQNDVGVPRTAGFYADLDRLLIGSGDIILSFDLSTGASNLENCYGIGLSRDSIEAKVLLAGSDSFAIDAIEFWSIQ